MFDSSEIKIHEFADFTVDETRRQLIRNGKPLPLTSKSFDTLAFLIRHRGKTVSKSDLMNAVWGDTAVEENNLTQQISALRRTFGERPNDHRFIVTVPGQGYSFVAEFNDTESDANPVLPHRVKFGLGPNGRSMLVGYSYAMTFMLLIAFGFVWAAIAHPGRQTLAVLSFRTTTGDESIGMDISDTLRARLGSVRDLTVRRGDFQGFDALDAGRDLNVDTVVTGSVQRDHERIRVAVEVLDVSDGHILWSRTFDDTASNLFALQDSIAGEIARVLNVSFARRTQRSTATNFVTVASFLLPRTNKLA